MTLNIKLYLKVYFLGTGEGL